MKRLSILVLSLGLCAGTSLSFAADAPPRPDGPPPRDGGGGPPGGGGFHILPRFVVEKLALTEEQHKQLADLEKETKDKLAKILTPEQLKILEQSRPPRPGGPGGGGPGGPDGGGPGGGQPGGDRPPRPPKE